MGKSLTKEVVKSNPIKLVQLSGAHLPPLPVSREFLSQAQKTDSTLSKCFEVEK